MGVPPWRNRDRIAAGSRSPKICELTKATREIVTVSLQAFEMWFICALLYLILTFSLSMCIKYLERRIVV